MSIVRFLPQCEEEGSGFASRNKVTLDTSPTVLFEHRGRARGSGAVNTISTFGLSYRMKVLVSIFPTGSVDDHAVFMEDNMSRRLRRLNFVE